MLFRSVVRTRSLMSIDGGRGRGVARAMEIPADDGGKSRSSPRKQHAAGKHKRTREEHSMNASVMSTVSVHDGNSVPSSKQSLVSIPPLSGGGATSTTTLATIQSVSRRSSTAAETPRPVSGSDKAGKGKRMKSPSRRGGFSPERLVSKLS